MLPLGLILYVLQQRLLRAWDAVRACAGDLLAAVGEAVTARRLRPHLKGIQDRTVTKVDAAVEAHRKSFVRAGGLGALLFPSGEIFGCFTVATWSWSPGSRRGPGGG